MVDMTEELREADLDVDPKKYCCGVHRESMWCATLCPMCMPGSDPNICLYFLCSLPIWELLMLKIYCCSGKGKRNTECGRCCCGKGCFLGGYCSSFWKCGCSSWHDDQVNVIREKAVNRKMVHLNVSRREVLREAERASMARKIAQSVGPEGMLEADPHSQRPRDRYVDLEGGSTSASAQHPFSLGSTFLDKTVEAYLGQGISPKYSMYGMVLTKPGSDHADFARGVVKTLAPPTLETTTVGEYHASPASSSGASNFRPFVPRGGELSGIRFTQGPPGYQVFDDGRTVVGPDKGGSYRLQLEMSCGKHTFRFRIVSLVLSMFYPGVGIMRPVFPDMKLWLKDSPDGIVYEAKTGAIGHNRTRVNYGEPMQIGDIIEMVVDFNEDTLSFSRNGHPQGVARRNLWIPCYPAVCTYSAGDSISLVDYEFEV